MRSVFVTVPIFSGHAVAAQHDVGEVRRFGEEDVLHDQMIERGERFAGVIDIRIGHRRVFAHDVHAANLVLLGGVHDLDHREAGIRIELVRHSFSKRCRASGVPTR